MIMDKAWAGVDAGKEFHWAHVLDASGRELLSRKVENDEADILKLIDEALSLAEEVLWAVDQPGGSAALLLALLWERDQKVLYVSGLPVWIGPATPIVESPKLTPAMPASSPNKPG
jgi:transposase